MDVKLMEMKLWNGTHAKWIFFKRADEKWKLRTFHFNNVKNAKARYEVLEDVNVMDNFVLGYEMQNVKDYLLVFAVEDRNLFVANEQGSEEWVIVC